jgi:hypothetical protein
MEESIIEKLIVLQLLKKFPVIYSNPKVYFRVHKGLKLDAMLCICGLFKDADISSTASVV